MNIYGTFEPDFEG